MSKNKQYIHSSLFILDNIFRNVMINFKSFDNLRFDCFKNTSLKYLFIDNSVQCPIVHHLVIPIFVISAELFLEKVLLVASSVSKKWQNWAHFPLISQTVSYQFQADIISNMCSYQPHKMFDCWNFNQYNPDQLNPQIESKHRKKVTFTTIAVSLVQISFDQVQHTRGTNSCACYDMIIKSHSSLITDFLWWDQMTSTFMKNSQDWQN